MLIKEYRVINNCTRDEYQVAQLYAVAEASKAETGGGEGVEVIKNEPYDNEKGKGQYTYKVYHLSSKVPAIIRVLAPNGALELYEEAWNAYPHCVTAAVKLRMQALNISPDLLEKRQVVIIDIANDPIDSKDYDENQDPTLYHSKNTGRGPLKDDWIVTTIIYDVILKNIYNNLSGSDFKVKSKHLSKTMQSLFTKFHRQLFCWTDGWYGLTMNDIRSLEDKTKKDLDDVIICLE
ncbi:13019_t:CDS:2 [Acaulospora colombiana]|uniref:13019_t:CDS:1 n=1 Tax=Acaulospora colombiana TaxID=27376 RepID=A0ACA9LTP0_9GLOM|nr:13019_t:CDS:2 [Acaulospora colombiana]